MDPKKLQGSRLVVVRTLAATFCTMPTQARHETHVRRRAAQVRCTPITVDLGGINRVRPNTRHFSSTVLFYQVLLGVLLTRVLV